MRRAIASVITLAGFLLASTGNAWLVEASSVYQQQVKLERGGKVIVSNPSGGIFIEGWDRDVLEARSLDDSGDASISVQGTTVRISRSPTRSGHGDIKVNVPRYADISLIEAHNGDVAVSSIEGAVTVQSNHGDLSVNQAGSLRAVVRHGDVGIRRIARDVFANTFSGDVTVDQVGGNADVATSQGDVTVRKVGGNVTVKSASGDIAIQCASGNADATNASGSISLFDIGGTADAATASGDVVFKGRVKPEGRYRLKTVSGDVEMMVEPDAPGFTATLQTYSGTIETQFGLQLDRPGQTGPTNRRVIGRYGDGKASIALDSFNGSVRIVKFAGAAADCR